MLLTEGKIPDDLQYSVLLPVFKGNGDPMECCSYRTVKFPEHALKVIEHVFETRIREKVVADDMQFGFRPGKGTTDAIFVVRQMHKKT